MEAEDHVFTHDTNDFITQSEWEPSINSKFDQFLQLQWQKAKDGGYFKYNLDHMETRVISGQFGFIAQLNTGRANLRRKPQEMMSLSQPFDTQKFNFTKIEPKEVLMELCCKHKSYLNQDRDKHVIVINVSPLEYCSVLLVPNIKSHLPQVLTMEALEVAIEMSLLSAKRSLLIGWNSLCALASVNHLHFHAYYLEHKLRVQSEPTNRLAGPCHVMPSWPVSAFVFQLEEGDVSSLARDVFSVADYLHNNEVAHNVCLTRGTPLGQPKSATHSTQNTLRVLIWPRCSVYGVKDVDAFNVAFSELAGHLPIMDELLFQELTDQSAMTALQHANLPPGKFKSIQRDILGLFQQT